MGRRSPADEMSGLFAVFAGLFAGAAGAMGLGGGGVLLIFLTVFAHTGQLKAQGINLLFFLACAMVAIIIHIKNKLLDLKTILKMAVPGVIGALLGTWIAGAVDTGILRIAFAVFLIVLGLKEVFTKDKPKETER